MGLKIVMLGAPGAGKGTQAVRMAEAMAIPHISTGDIFRKHLREGTELGKKVQEIINAGHLVPDELTCQIVADRLLEEDCKNGYILDGFPRTLAQAEALKAMLAERNDQLDMAIDVDVPDEEIVGRLGARRSDPETGAVYNLKFNPPPAEIADRCILRDDDKPEVIQERLRIYHETTKPIIGYYDQEGILKTIPASGMSPDDVYAAIQAILN